MNIGPHPRSTGGAGLFCVPGPMSAAGTTLTPGRARRPDSQPPRPRRGRTEGQGAHDQYVDVRYLVDHPAMDPFTQASLPPVEGRWQPADGIRAFGVRSITEPRVLFPDHDPACAYCEHGPNSVDCATRVPGPAEDAFVCRDCRTELARARIAADPRNHDDYGWEE